MSAELLPTTDILPPNTIKNLRYGEPLSVLFPKGTVLWRHVGFSKSRFSSKVSIHIDPITFPQTEKGSYIGRVLLSGEGFIHEPCAVNSRYGEVPSSGGASVGLIVFLDKQPEPNWTHLLVTGVSKVLKEPWNPEIKLKNLKGGCIFATPGNPLSLDDYQDFRLATQEEYSRQMFGSEATNLEKLVLGYSKIWPRHEMYPEERRLVLGCVFDGEVAFEYTFMGQDNQGRVLYL